MTELLEGAGGEVEKVQERGDGGAKETGFGRREVAATGGWWVEVSARRGADRGREGTIERVGLPLFARGFFRWGEGSGNARDEVLALNAKGLGDLIGLKLVIHGQGRTHGLRVSRRLVGNRGRAAGERGWGWR